MSEGKLYLLLAAAGLVPLLLVLFLGHGAHAAVPAASDCSSAAFCQRAPARVEGCRFSGHNAYCGAGTRGGMASTVANRQERWELLRGLYLVPRIFRK